MYSQSTLIARFLGIDRALDNTTKSMTSRAFHHILPRADGFYIVWCVLSRFDGYLPPPHPSHPPLIACRKSASPCRHREAIPYLKGRQESNLRLFALTPTHCYENLRKQIPTSARFLPLLSFDFHLAPISNSCQPAHIE